MRKDKQRYHQTVYYRVLISGLVHRADYHAKEQYQAIISRYRRICIDERDREKDQDLRDLVDLGLKQKQPCAHTNQQVADYVHRYRRSAGLRKRQDNKIPEDRMSFIPAEQNHLGNRHLPGYQPGMYLISPGFMYNNEISV